MICGKCVKSSSLFLKQIKCESCGLHAESVLNGVDICIYCSNQYNICQICGENFSKPIEIDWVHVNKQGE